MKYFIITVDTEGDNLWSYHKGEEVKTKNSFYIPRFQELCEKFGFKPVYLTNYEMVNDSDYVKYMKPKALLGKCEVGIHIHGWNNPPIYDLKGNCGGNAFLVEYPDEIMDEKFKLTYDLITKKFGRPPVSHRAGRWVMDDRYFKLLEKYKIKVDCSYTPNVSWMNTKGDKRTFGCDYSQVPCNAHCVGEVLEVPMSISKTRIMLRCESMKSMIKHLIKGKSIWLRPASSSLREMKWLVNSDPNKDNYVEFMIHSSELMPNGSPYFKKTEDIDQLFKTMERLFSYALKKGYVGCTLEEYYGTRNK